MGNEVGNVASVVGTLDPQQIAQTQAQSQAITDAAQVGAISSNQFVFFAAFDGTNDDKTNLSLSGLPQSSNVGQLWDQYSPNVTPGSNLGGNYYAGVGTPGTPWGSSAIPSQVT